MRQRSSVHSSDAESRLSADTNSLRPTQTSSPNTIPDPDDNKYAKEAPPSSTRTNALLHTLAWLIAAALVTYYTHLIPTLLHDNRLHHTALYIGLLSLAVSLSAFLHLAYVVPRQSAGSDDLYGVSPHSVHVSLVCGLVWYVCWCGALWPVYSLLSTLR